MKIDIINKGQEFIVPALNINIQTDLYLDLLKISVDAEREFKDYKDTKDYEFMLSQRINQKRLMRILKEIDPGITVESVDKKGIMWINNTLREIYENTPDKNLDFQRTAEADKDSLLPSSTMSLKDTSTEPL